MFRKRSCVAGAGFAVVLLAALGAVSTVGVMLQIGLAGAFGLGFLLPRHARAQTH